MSEYSARSDGTTHSEHCWSFGPKHYDCAVRCVAKLEEDYALAKESIDFLDGELTRALACAEAAEASLATMREELKAWRECAEYDAMMDGPKFKGWNRSALDRCRVEFIEAALTANKGAQHGDL